MCHTLAAAGSGGLIGPDLDAVRPSTAQVRRAVRLGSIDGVMQPGLLRGREARAWRAYVARVAAAAVAAEAATRARRRAAGAARRRSPSRGPD